MLRHVAMLLVLTIAVLASGCGSGSGENPDAAVAVDAPVSDAAVDAEPPIPISAVAAGNITAVTLTGGQETRVPYTSVDYDDQLEFDTATSTFTAKYAGDYLVCASLMIDLPTFSFSLMAYKNASSLIAVATGVGVAAGCHVVRLAPGDKLDVRATNTATANRSAAPDPSHQWMTISRVSSVMSASPDVSFMVPRDTPTRVPYQHAWYGDSSQLDVNSNSFIAAQAGDYQFCAGVHWGGPTRGELRVAVNGTVSAGLAGGTRPAVNGCYAVRLAASDAVAMYAYQNEGAFAIPPFDPRLVNMIVQKQPIAVSIAGIADFEATAQTWTKVPYETELVDDQAQYDTSAHTFTAAAAGDYVVCASLVTRTADAAPDELAIYRNGVREKTISWGTPIVGGCRVLRLAPSEHVDLYVSPGVTTSLSSTSWDWLTISRLH